MSGVLGHDDGRISSIDGVLDLHLLRTRRMGADALVDVHILVDSRLSLSEGHQIGDVVHARLTGDFDEVTDVTVHIDPENDARIKLSAGLPLRDVVVGRLQQCWAHIPAAAHIERITLHYLNGKVHVELLLPLAAAEGHGQAQVITDELRTAAGELDEIGDFEVYFR